MWSTIRSAVVGRPSEVSSVNARKALISVFALAAMTLTSCGTLNRAGKDLVLGAGTPILMVYGGATDGLESAQSVRAGLGSGAAVQVVAFPFTFFYHAIEHGIYGLVHLVDLPMCALYGPAELHPSGPEVMPLDIYQGTPFDSWAGKQGTDAESGEMVPAGN
jgi:predicted small secreted protein